MRLLFSLDARCVLCLLLQRNDTPVGVSRAPFLQQIRDRLAFLGFFLSESMLPVTVDHVDRLWGLCAADGHRLTAQEQDVVLEVRPPPTTRVIFRGRVAFSQLGSRCRWRCSDTFV